MPETLSSTQRAAPRLDLQAEAEAATGAALPVRRADLILVPHSNAGECVVKDPARGTYFHLGPEESFLLRALDGGNSADAICAGFEQHFGAALTRQDLDDFLELAGSMNLLVDPMAPAEKSAQDGAPSPGTVAQDKSEQSILFWRKRIFDPDRLFNRIEPRIRFVWTRGFVALAALAMLAAFSISWANRQELVSRFADALSWQTFFIAWLTICVATTLHEFAHGLTCKHYGGEVHEVGFLLIFFLPAFYANVSDAWLFPEKSRRLYVTLAGGFCDLCLWAVAVFVWRLTIQDSLTNYLAWVIMTICGVRSFFNFMPLLKLDGYYLLSDLTSTPNLRQRGWETLMAHLRWLLWGAPRPQAEPKRAYLLAFGLGVWLYAMSFLTVLAVAVIAWLRDSWGPPGALAATLLAASVLSKQFDGISNGEVIQMWRERKVRVGALVLLLAAAAAVMTLVPLEDRAGGTFQVRSTTRQELRATTAGFLLEVHGDEGDRVSAGATVAQLHVPDLDSRIAQKRAECTEADARLRLLRLGPRGPRTHTEAALESEIRKAEIDGAVANLARLEEELNFLETRAKKLPVRAAVAGVISTPRLREQVGRYFNDGDLICVIEEPAELEVQIDVPEQEAARVAPGQEVTLKARALPFEQLQATVTRVAPGAVGPDPKEGKMQGTVAVYCTLSGPAAALRPGMTGFARVSCGKRAMGRVLADKALRHFRTEFWW